MAAGLLGLVYGICAGVILAAYHEFASQSLHDRSPLVAADPTPLKLLPKERTQDDTTMSRGPAGQGSPAAALADAASPASPIGEIRPAMAHRSDAEQAGEIDTSSVVEGLDSARGGAEPEPLGDDLIPEQLSVAAVPETRLEAGAAALPEAAPAAPYEPSHPEAAAALPPTPSFKPLDAIPTLMVEAALAPVALGPPEASRRRTGRMRPPRPSLKPIIDPSEARPEPAGEQGAPTVAATGHTLPEALRALWTNLKILLASAPASSDFRTRVGRADGNGGGGTGASSADGSNSSGGGNSPSGSGGTNARGGSSATGGSTSDGGGNSSSGAGRTSSDGGSSTSGGGSGSTASGGGSGSSASSGGSGSSVSSGGSGGRGRGNGGRGGRGGDDRDDDDRDGRGGGRGGDDDDDDDDD